MGSSVHFVRRLRFKIDILYVNIQVLFLVICVELLLEVLFFSPSGDMTVHTYICYIWKITWRPTFITDDRKKYIFQNSVFEKKLKRLSM
jgi:hypothetical protein